MQISQRLYASRMPSELSSTSDLMMEIAKREQEVSALREKGLNDLRAELKDADAQIACTRQKFNALKEDFQYNLGLLAERDQELDRCEQLLQNMTLAATEKDELVSQMKSEMAQIQHELSIQRARAAEAEAACQMQRIEAAQAAESDSLAKQELLRLQQEEGEAHRRKLQRALAVAENELEQQRQELSQQFTDRTRWLEAEYKVKADDAWAAAESSKAFTERLEHDRTLLQERVQVLEAYLQERDKELQKLRSDMRTTVQTKDRELRTLQTEHNGMEMKVKDAMLENAMHKEALQNQLLQNEAKIASLEAELRQVHSLNMQQSERYQQSLCESADTLQKLQTELSTCQTALQLTRKDMEDKLTAASENLQSERASYEAMFRSATEARDSEISQLKHSLFEHTTQLASLRSQMETMSASLEERQADVARCKEELHASLNREAELKRQLLQAQLRSDQVATASEEAADLSNKELIESLIRQRDSATELCKDLKDEVDKLRHKSQSQAEKRALEHVAKRQSNVRSFQGVKRSSLQITVADPASLADQHIYDPSKAAIAPMRPGTESELPSPSTIASIPPSPDYVQIPPAHVSGESLQTESRAASLRTSDRNAKYSQVMVSLEKLIRGPPDEGDIVRTSVDSLAESETMEMENHRLRMTVLELESQQERLQSTISMMREEMEGHMQQLAIPRDRSQPEASAGVQETDRLNAITRTNSDHVTVASNNAYLTTSLQRRLNRCQAEVKRLARENERLMEVGNELRAERNMAAHAQNQLAERIEADPAWMLAQVDGNTETPRAKVTETAKQDMRCMSAPERSASEVQTGTADLLSACSPSAALFVASSRTELEPSPSKGTQTHRTLVSGKASDRELPSQRAKLEFLKRSRYQKPKIRNYNIIEE